MYAVSAADRAKIASSRGRCVSMSTTEATVAIKSASEVKQKCDRVLEGSSDEARLDVEKELRDARYER